MSEERFGLSGNKTVTGGIGAEPIGGVSESLIFPSGTYETGEDRFGLPSSFSTSLGGIGGITSPIPSGAVSGLDMTPETITVDIDFSASSYEDVLVPLDAEIRFLLMGRLYIDEDPGADFDHWCSYTFYSTSDRKGAEAYYRNVVKVSYTELEVATTGSDANITPDVHSYFAEQNVVRFLDDGEMARIKTAGDTMIAEDIVGAHSIDTGISRVSEFTNLALYNTQSSDYAYLRVEFGSSQTVSLKMELDLIS